MLPVSCKMCRVCGMWPERQSHLPQCAKFLEVFQRFHNLAASCIKMGDLDEPLMMLGWMGSAYLPPALSAIHIILWKFIMITFTRIEIHGEKWDTEAIWAQTLHRARTRFIAHAEGARRWSVARWAKGDTIPVGVITRWNRQVEPVAYYDDEGNFKWKVPIPPKLRHAPA